MKQFDSNFKFSESYYPMTSIELTDPQMVMCTKNGAYYPLGKSAARRVNTNYGMRSAQFSNQLNDHDPELWKALRDKSANYDSVIEYKSTHVAMIIDGLVVNILDSSEYLSKFMSIISQYVSDDTLNCFYNCTEEEFQFICFKKVSDGECAPGVIIRYYLDNNWITISNAYYTNDAELYVSSSPICDKEVENDLETIMDKEFLISSCDLISAEYATFVKEASEATISLEELFSYLKYDFGIKIKYSRIDPIEYLANSELNAEVAKFVNDVLTYIYDTPMYRYVSASSLKRSVTFSTYSFYDYFKVLSSMYQDDQVNLNSLCNFTRTVINGMTNYDRVKEN